MYCRSREHRRRQSSKRKKSNRGGYSEHKNQRIFGNRGVGNFFWVYSIDGKSSMQWRREYPCHCFLSFCLIFAGTVYLSEMQKYFLKDYLKAADRHHSDYSIGVWRNDSISVFVVQLHTTGDGDNHPLYLSGLHDFGMRDFSARKNQKNESARGCAFFWRNFVFL